MEENDKKDLGKKVKVGRWPDGYIKKDLVTRSIRLEQKDLDQAQVAADKIGEKLNKFINLAVKQRIAQNV